VKAAEAAATTAPGPLLDARMREHFLAGFAARAGAPGVRTLAAAAAAPVDGVPQAVQAGLLEVDAADLAGDLVQECFGPVTVLVRYRDAADAERVLSLVGGNLTATLQAEADEPGAGAWLARLSRFAGRVIFGGWPTGVSVAPAMTHGGPYPATTTPTTSVGGTAIDRWLRPVTYQTVPAALLPAELA
jgi:NADP-dependent aldehyde dehydrogenase